jgi:SAM-dependent methyltransferase
MDKPNQDNASRAEASPDNASVTAIYGSDYAAVYNSLYLKPWKNKHELNARNLTAVLDGLAAPMPDWLDIACGQAWHFSMFQGRARMVGLDLSAAQLALARARVANAAFLQEDVVRANFPRASFDLVTNFWAGYCYLGSQERIAAVLRKAVGWIRGGGALYMEVLLARDLESFNSSHFAGHTGFAVKPRSEDYTEWQYEDVGGRHDMFSPPLDFFIDLLAPEFSAIQARHDSAFMVHLIATGRKPNP